MSDQTTTPQPPVTWAETVASTGTGPTATIEIDIHLPGHTVPIPVEVPLTEARTLHTMLGDVLAEHEPTAAALAREQATPEPDERPGDPALAEIERLAVELYQAQDTLAWIGELCDIADREDRSITTADVRAWLRGPQCARRLVITDGPLVDAVRAARPGGGA